MTTQYANASYQEVIDLHTESDKVSVVGIHTPNSDTPVNMLRGFWSQFRKFKYNGCSISLVPAAQLPADPLQVSYEAGEPTIDPRDMLNPILFHGCHGDDMGSILNNLYTSSDSGSFVTIDNKSDSADLNVFPQSAAIPGTGDIGVYEALYYKAMTDRTWLKAHPQRGFRKSGLHPMVYSLATTMQMGALQESPNARNPTGIVHNALTGAPSEAQLGVAGEGPGGSLFGGFQFGRPVFDETNNTFKASADRSNIGLFTPRLQRLGWLDTRQVLTGTGSTGPSAQSNAIAGLAMAEQVGPTLVPKIFMGMIMLPPAYKTEQYFRLIINHSFSFAKFRGASMDYANTGMLNRAFNVYNFNVADDRKHIDPEKDGDEKDGADKVE